MLVQSLDVEDLDVILGAFKEVSVKKGETLIHQGDDGDKLYLIESGEADVFKEMTNESTKKKEVLKVNTMKKGDTVGELALMYNAPRAATVVATTDLELWSLDRETFSHIVRDAASKQRALYEDSLKEARIHHTIEPHAAFSLAILEKHLEEEQFFRLLRARKPDCV